MPFRLLGQVRALAPHFRKLALPAAILAALLAWNSPATAQTLGNQPATGNEAPAQVFGDWHLRCRPFEEGAPDTCILLQNLINLY